MPATVAMVPLTNALRRRWLFVSAISTALFKASKSTPCGLLRLAAVAGPPSPPKPAVPSPAIVVIVPLADTLRTRLLP